jgi:hypothetical protein
MRSGAKDKHGKGAEHGKAQGCRHGSHNRREDDDVTGCNPYAEEWN